MTKAIVVLAALVALCVAAGAAGSGSGGTIVFAADRAPTLAGEVWKLGPGGTPVDLSKDLASDSGVSVSPDGTKAAFFSRRGGHAAEYVVNLDGTHLRRVSPYLRAPSQVNAVSVAWAPDGKTLAALVETSAPTAPQIFLASPSGGLWRALTRPREQPVALTGWSPRGTSLAYVSTPTGSVRVIDPRGKLLLDAAGERASWSPTGRLAVQRNDSTVDVYAPSLKHAATISAAYAAWSSADVLATITAKGLLQLRTHGVGRPVLARSVGRPALVSGPVFSSLQWLGPRRLRVYGDNGWFLVDAKTGHTFILNGAFAAFDSVVSYDGQTALGEVSDERTSTSKLLLSKLGGSTRTLATTTACGVGTGYENLNLLRGDVAVYDSGYCLVNADVYSVAPDGSALRQLTSTPADESQPALSPDGTKIAYVWQQTWDGCKGCTHTIWLMNADGSGARVFPNGPDPEVNYDDSPSFSPDGASILFSRSGPDKATLYIEPAAGGAAKSLGVAGLYPAWGPSKIVFDDLKTGLSVAGPNGKNATALKAQGEPAWSPDGRLAVLEQDAKGGLSIVITGSGKKIPLAGFQNVPRGGGLAWSPDGARFAFVAVDRAGVSDVWTIGADGTGLKRVTDGLGAVGTLSWR
jgi:Tol biopolymer transport system component